MRSESESDSLMALPSSCISSFNLSSKSSPFSDTFRVTPIFDFQGPSSSHRSVFARRSTALVGALGRASQDNFCARLQDLSHANSSNSETRVPRFYRLSFGVLSLIGFRRVASSLFLCAGCVIASTDRLLILIHCSISLPGDIEDLAKVDM